MEREKTDKMNKAKEQIKAVMLGHAVGDELGVPVEFCVRSGRGSIRL